MRRILTNKGLLEFSIAAELNQGKSHVFTGKSDLIMVSPRKRMLDVILSKYFQLEKKNYSRKIGKIFGKY